MPPELGGGTTISPKVASVPARVAVTAGATAMPSWRSASGESVIFMRSLSCATGSTGLSPDLGVVAPQAASVTTSETGKIPAVVRMATLRTFVHRIAGAFAPDRGIYTRCGGCLREPVLEGFLTRRAFGGRTAATAFGVVIGGTVSK